MTKDANDCRKMQLNASDYAKIVTESDIFSNGVNECVFALLIVDRRKLCVFCVNEQQTLYKRKNVKNNLRIACIL